MIADRVVEKIVERAVTEVDQAAGVSRHGLRVGRFQTPARPRVSATVDGDLATVRVTMSVLWPASVPEVTERVRERIAGRLFELATLRIAEIAIDVAQLPTSYGARRRRVS